MSDDFVDTFVSNCIDSGVSSPSDICELVNNEIQEIDKQIEEVIVLRKRRDNLNKVLKSFNYNKPNERKLKPCLVNVPESDLINDPEYIKLSKTICDVVRDSDYPLLTRELACQVGYGDSDATFLYMTIKEMCSNKLLVKNSDRTLSLGDVIAEDVSCAEE